MGDFSEVKAGIDENINDFKKRIDEALGSDMTVEVDYDSYENASAKDRVWYRAKYTGWDGYYIMREAAYGIERCARDYDGADVLKAGISTIKFVHEEPGCPREEACRMEGDTLIIGGSHCCWSHQFNDWTLRKYLARQFDLIIAYYIKQITEVAIPEAYEEMDNDWEGSHIEIEFDEASFDYNDLEGEERKIRREDTLENAAYWRGYYPIRGTASYLTSMTNSSYYDDITKEEVLGCVEKIVISNIPNAGDDYYAYYKRNVHYNMDTKVLTLNSVYESWWGHVYPSEARDKVREICLIYRLGEFNEMTIDQHEVKIKLLEYVVNSWDVYYNRFDYLKDVLRYPCFYPKTHHERQCFVALMEHINGAKFRADSVPEDVREAEEITLLKRGEDPETFKETFIAGWTVEKITYRGLIQDRLLFVTDRATYVAKPNWKSKKVESLHRYAHEHYTRVNAGEYKVKNVGGPSLGVDADLPGVDMPNVDTPDMPDMPDVPDMPNVDLPDGPNIKGLSLADFKGPPWAVRIESDRPRSDEKKIPSFKMPDIPNLKESLCNMLRKMTDAIKDVEFPDFNPPGLPEFKVPNLLEVMGKAKPKMPDGSAPTYDPNAVVYCCGEGVPNDPPGMDKFTELNQKCNDMDDPPVIKKLPGMPDNILPDLLGKLTDSVESMTELSVDIPKEFTLDGILKMLGKKLAKMSDAAGISMPSLPDLDFGAGLDLLQETVAESENAAEIAELIGEVRKGAAEMCPIKWPDFPKLDPSRLLDEICGALAKVELPEMPDMSEFMPELPSLPGMPSVDMPGAPDMPDMPGMPVSMSVSTGPKKPELMTGNFKFEMPDGVDAGVSKYVALEVAWVVYAGARAYRRPYGTSSPWINYTVECDSTTMATAYNTIKKGKVSKPSGEGTPIEDGAL